VLGCAERADDTVIADPVSCTVDGLRNCAQTGTVIFGSQPSPAALEYLAEQGYTTVVSTRGVNELDWDERAAVEALGMRFVSIPMENPVTEITDEQVARLAEVIENPDGPTLLHCGSGNRVSGLWGAYLAERAGVEPDRALELAEQAGMTGVRPVVEVRLGVASTAR
jgi:uncharacterized protein (TIGR01244 family)